MSYILATLLFILFDQKKKWGDTLSGNCEVEKVEKVSVCFQDASKKSIFLTSQTIMRKLFWKESAQIATVISEFVLACISLILPILACWCISKSNLLSYARLEKEGEVPFY